MALKTNRKEINYYYFPGGKTVIRVSLIVSFFFHVGLLFAFQQTFAIHWFAQPLKTYHVELIRPPMDPLDDEQLGSTDLSDLKSQKVSPPGETEDTISLNTSDKRYTSYAKIVKARLMHHWKYPSAAKEKLIEGKVLVSFSLNRQGHLLEIRILNPSDYLVLNSETERAIQSASPFPPFPGSVTVKRLNIKADFSYRLTKRPQRYDEKDE